MIIGKKINVFSYPFGGKDTYDDRTIEILKDEGYLVAVANYPDVAGSDTPVYEIPRILVRNWDVRRLDYELRRVRTLYGN